MANRSNRVHHNVNLNMIGLFRIKKSPAGMLVPSYEQDEFIGNWESIEGCLEYCNQPDRHGYVQSNRTLCSEIDEYTVGFRLKYLIANTPYKENILEFRTPEELRAHLTRRLSFEDSRCLS